MSHNLEQSNHVENLKDYSNLDLPASNKGLEDNISTLSQNIKNNTQDIKDKYPNIKFSGEVSDDAQEELANRTNDAEEEYAKTKNDLENPVVKIMDSLTQPKAETDEKSTNLNIAAQKPEMSFFERGDGVLAGNANSPKESINSVV